ncbi:hypothetical protein BDZ94DRAFT_1249187 [Collybia nuda]|uniref:Uncharacterized protein n=1 Tax=Collybia nuda TaxID=64659 RepID=A0A9P5YC49_9AGAR|nr:hypothetical protein BDZ94DRAFT_1249187 [Collybia nuda]
MATALILIKWMIAPAVALSFYRSVVGHLRTYEPACPELMPVQRMSSFSQRLNTAETRLGKLERKQAAAAARLRRQRSNLAPQNTLSADAATNRLSR